MKLFIDSADPEDVIAATKDGDSIKEALNNHISGVTTNPTLIKQYLDSRKESYNADGVYMDYVTAFTRALRSVLPEGCVSFEVTSRDKIRAFGEAIALRDVGRETNYQVYVKVPFYAGFDPEDNVKLIGELSRRGVFVNVTAVTNAEQVRRVFDVLDTGTPSIVSIFAGRIADASLPPAPLFRCEAAPSLCETLWASSRQPYSYFEALSAGANIVTMTPSMLSKLVNTTIQFADDMNKFAAVTAEMFYTDAGKAGLYL